jgi:mono/diheme cytochrome c family protein
MRKRTKLRALIAGLAVAGAAEAAPPERWYSEAQVDAGRALFQEHCASCHGANAEGTPDWKKRGPDGKYPPPPLNGTGHAWHHSMSVLKRTIDRGGVPLGGWMPAFKGKFTEAEKEALIAFIQSHWPDEVYAAWLKRGGLK